MLWKVVNILKRLKKMYLKTQVKKNSLILMSKVAIVWLFIVLLEAKINLTNMMKMKINQIELQDS